MDTISYFKILVLKKPDSKTLNLASEEGYEKLVKMTVLNPFKPF